MSEIENIDNLIFTRKERTVKKYTIGQAVNSAARRLGERFVKRHGICKDAIVGRDDSEKITLLELNQISDRIYDDSVYYAL